MSEPWPVVQVIGIGDDGPAGLAELQRSLIAQADLLCGGQRQLAFFPAHPAERLLLKGGMAPAIEHLARAPETRRAVVLASGDPCFFGIGPQLVRRLGRERVRIHPHVSSVALAFARAGLAWQDAAVLSAHGRPLAPVVRAARHLARFAVLTEPAPNTPSSVGVALIEAGIEGTAPVWVCEHLGGARERIVHSTLRGLVGQSFAALNVLVVDRDPAGLPGAVVAAADGERQFATQAPRGDRAVTPVAPTPAAECNAVTGPPTTPALPPFVVLPQFGVAETAYASERGQITKAEVRAVTLAKLQPWQAAVAWDVGSGSGALAIELAGLMPAGSVFAVERDPAQQEVLAHNLARFPRPNLHRVPGAAPAALAGLPRPDAVFVGGAGRDLDEVLRTAIAALRAGGSLVANFALLESLSRWQSIASATGWPSEIVQVAVSRGVTLGEGTRLAPLGPVFVTVLRRPQEPDR